MELSLIVLSYLIGSIPFGLVLTKLSGHGDIRKTGSGNIGATNVLRTGNKGLAFMTLILDGGKGALMVFLASLFLTYNPAQDSAPAELSIALHTLVGGAAILGHCFPIWLKFKGGKGVATTLGTLLIAVPYAGLAACITWLLSAFLFKISSLSALIAIAIAPLVTFFVYGQTPASVCTLIMLLVWVRHKDNIKRLLKGEEPKIGDKKNNG